MVFVARRRDRPSELQVSPRAEWYDRNPNMTYQYYHGTGVAPHSVVARWSYTVPTGKKAFIESLLIMIQRTAVATSAGRFRGDIAATYPAFMKVYNYGNVVGSGESRNQGYTGCLPSGFAVSAITEDLSTGGTVDYWLDMVFCEFDA